MDLEPVANDPGVSHEARDVLGGETRDPGGIESGEGLAVPLTLPQDRRPGEASLRSVQQKLLVPAPIVVDRNAPLLVVVGEHQRVITGPEAALDRGGRHSAQHTVLSIVLIDLGPARAPVRAMEVGSSSATAPRGASRSRSAL